MHFLSVVWICLLKVHYVLECPGSANFHSGQRTIGAESGEDGQLTVADYRVCLFAVVTLCAVSHSTSNVWDKGWDKEWDKFCCCHQHCCQPNAFRWQSRAQEKATFPSSALSSDTWRIVTASVSPSYFRFTVEKKKALFEKHKEKMLVIK